MLGCIQKNIREITLAKGHCANTVRHLMKDERSIAAVDTAIAFGNYSTDMATLIATTDAAYAAVAAVADAAVAAAAATAANTAAAAAAVAAAAAAAAADTYADAAADRASANQLMTADICRKYLMLGERNV